MGKFGELLKRHREAQGLTQAALATASGIPLRTIQDYEQERREPAWHVVVVLADALGVGVEEFRPDAPPTGKRGRPRKRKDG